MARNIVKIFTAVFAALLCFSCAGGKASGNPFASGTLDSAILTHSGPYDFTDDADLEGFFAACGFAADAPFYQYHDPDGRLQLALWYDAEAQMGAGVRYSYYGGETDRYGFGFEALSEDAPLGRWEEDFAAPPVRPADVQLENYKESPEYDGEGRLIAFSAECTLEGEPEWVYQVSYQYGPSGGLASRSFGQNPQIFGTSGSSANSFFDGQGRLLYERRYLTHGGLELYCLYAAGTEGPAYCLYLDDNMGLYFPQFIQL